SFGGRGVSLPTEPALFWRLRREGRAEARLEALSPHPVGCQSGSKSGPDSDEGVRSAHIDRRVGLPPSSVPPPAANSGRWLTLARSCRAPGRDRKGARSFRAPGNAPCI